MFYKNKFLFDPVRSSTKYQYNKYKYNNGSTCHMSKNLKKKTIHVQCIKSWTPHEQCPARRTIPSIDDDVKKLAGIAPWSQKNGTPHNAIKPNLPLTKGIYIYKTNEGR
jgi:predicted aldo/keto reductase-like oxidoreductase